MTAEGQTMVSLWLIGWAVLAVVWCLGALRPGGTWADRVNLAWVLAGAGVVWAMFAFFFG